MQTMFSSSSYFFQNYVAHPPLWWYSTLLPPKLWRHKRKRFTNLMNQLKQVFLVAHLFDCSLVQLYLFQMCSLFFCVLLDVIGFRNCNNIMHECKLLFRGIHIFFFHVLWLFVLWNVMQRCVYFYPALSDRVLRLFHNATNV